MAGLVGCWNGLAWVLTLTCSEKPELRPKYAPAPRCSSQKHGACTWAFIMGVLGLAGGPCWSWHHLTYRHCQEYGLEREIPPTVLHGREHGDEAWPLQTTIPNLPYLRGSWMPG